MNINILIGLLCLLFSGLGVIATLISIRFACRIAKKSGAFKTTKMQVSFFGENLYLSEKDRLSFCFLHPGKEGEAAFYPMAFDIANSGDAPCKNAVLTIQASKACIPKLPENDFSIDVTPGIFKGSTTRSVVHIGGFNQVSYALPTIGPKNAMRLMEEFIFLPSSLSGNVDAETLDGHFVRVGYKLEFLYPITITLLLENSPSLQVGFDICCICADSSKEAIRKFLQPIRVAERRFISQKSFLSRIFFILFKRRYAKEAIFLEFETHDSGKEGGKPFYRMGLLNGSRIKCSRIKYWILPTSCS